MRGTLVKIADPRNGVSRKDRVKLPCDLRQVLENEAW
jgi:hypothetical protein